MSVYPTYSSNEITLRLTTNLSTSQQIDSSYSIPLQLSYTEDGQYYTRLFDIKINRINSGAKGVAPTLYKLIVNKDAISVNKNSSGNNVFNDTLPIVGRVEMSNEEGVWEKVKMSTSTTLKLRSVGIDGSTNPSTGASVFSYTSDGITWQYNPASAPANLYNSYGNHFLIQLGNSDFSVIYDQEAIDFIFNGKDGKDGTNGSQGLQGCVVRESLIDDGTSDTIYRNDSNWSTTSQIRYIDVVGVPSSYTYAKDGFEWFIVKPSGTISTVENTGSKKVSYSTAESELKTYVAAEHHAPLVNFEVLSNVGGIYSSFILAKNAKIKFQTSNELTIVGRDNSTIVAGLTGGGNSSNNVRIWAGTTESDVNNAPFRVYEDGSLVAQNADIVGQVSGSNGQFATSLYGPKGSFVIREDGSGYAAFGNIRWDENGKVEIINATFTDCYGVTGDITSGSGNNSDIDTLSNVVVSNVTFANNSDPTKVNATFTIKNNNSTAVTATLTLWAESTDTYISGTSLIPYWTAVSSGMVKIELSAGQSITRTVTYNKGYAYDNDYSSQPLNGKRGSGDILNASWIRITDVVSADSQAKPATWGDWPD